MTVHTYMQLFHYVPVAECQGCLSMGKGPEYQG